MHVKATSSRRPRAAPLALLCVLAASPVWAQPSSGTAASLEAALEPGMTTWITDASGREEKARVVSISRGVLTMQFDDAVRELPATDITRVRARRSDSVLNGALIGAGAAVAGGLFLCTRTEPWENCRDDVGPIVKIAALGAGIGIGIDALIRGRKTIYEAGRTSLTVRAEPTVGRGAAGFRVAFGF